MIRIVLNVEKVENLCASNIDEARCPGFITMLASRLGGVRSILIADKSYRADISHRADFRHTF